MRPLSFSLTLGVTLLMLGVAPSDAAARRPRPMMSRPRPMMSRPRPMMNRPMMHRFRHDRDRDRFLPRIFNPFLASRMQFGGSGVYGASSGGYSPYQMPYGGSGMYAAPYEGYSPYQTPYSGYDSYSSSSASSSQAGRLPRARTSDEIEVSGPLDAPPPHRAIIRLRLPRTWVDVGIDGRKVDSIGRSRTYVTPELSRPRTFEVTAVWKNNGRSIRMEDQVTVDAGQIRTLDFTSGN